MIVRITPTSAHGTLFILPFTVGQVAQVDKPSTDQTPPDLYSVVFSLLIPTGILMKKNIYIIVAPIILHILKLYIQVLVYII